MPPGRAVFAVDDAVTDCFVCFSFSCVYLHIVPLYCGFFFVWRVPCASLPAGHFAHSSQPGFMLGCGLSRFSVLAQGAHLITDACMYFAFVLA